MRYVLQYGHHRFLSRYGERLWSVRYRPIVPVLITHVQASSTLGDIFWVIEECYAYVAELAVCAWSFLRTVVVRKKCVPLREIFPDVAWSRLKHLSALFSLLAFSGRWIFKTSTTFSIEWTGAGWPLGRWYRRAKKQSYTSPGLASDTIVESVQLVKGVETPIQHRMWYCTRYASIGWLFLEIYVGKCIRL